MENKINSVSGYIKIVMKWRRMVIRNVIIVTILALIISLVLRPKFTATTTILPPSNEEGALVGLTGILASQAAFGASLSRLGFGLSRPSDLYAAILRSGRIKSEIINRFDLKKRFKAKTMYDAFKALNKITKINVTAEGIIEVSVTHQDKYLAADMANAFIEELDKFNTQTRMTMGKRYRIFLENRLRQTEKDLAAAEDSLRKFKEKHRTVALDEEMKSAIEIIAKLKSEQVIREIQRGAFASANDENNPYILNLDQQIKAIEKQLSAIEFGTKSKNRNEFGAGFSIPFCQLPQLSLELARLTRNFKVQEAIYELLTQSYEQAKLLELRDTPTVQILDVAAPPEKKSWPKRSLIVSFTFVLSLAASVLLAFILEYDEDVRQNPDRHLEFINFRNQLQSDLNRIKNYLRFRSKK
ncbi:MAG: GNVR domain-containing protein [candidate division WOR-3 bacterium]